MASRPISRRSFLGAATAGTLGVGIDLASGATPAAAVGRADPGARTARLRTGFGGLRGPGSLPDPKVPAGTDQVPEIENFIVVMMENHSFDNILGMLGRGDCWPRGPEGKPTITMSDGHGNLVSAFHMPSECQTNGVGQNWNLAHHSLVHDNHGFVEGSTGEALGYFHGSDLPFTWDMARVFPIADRWFASVLGQTDPNRRFLMAGTSLGQINDGLNSDLPPNGTIFDLLNRFGITWKDYYSNVPSIGVWLPLLGEPSISSHINLIDQFYVDAGQGALPQFSFVEPDYNHSSEENPQDIQFGDQFLAGIVNAVMSGPQWERSMLIWTYDEWGGWYDHVRPPAAVPPDDVPPVILSSNQAPGGFDQYGFRVPGGVVSPFAIRDFVSHVTYDHTSVLATLERKWNLPAMTRRDANALDLFDMVDLSVPPAFLQPPRLHSPANPLLSEGCLATGPGTIPPRHAVARGAVPNTPVVGPATLPTGMVGTPYQVSLTASPIGRQPQWSLISGVLPAGLALDRRSGRISGTPTQAGSSGVTFGVSSNRLPTGVQGYSIVIAD